jgi:hypothetical protein
VIVRVLLRKVFVGLTLLVCLSGCGQHASLRRTLREVGPENLRAEMLAVCREGFAKGALQRVPLEQLPASARAFNPMGAWAEPDGGYILIDSDADGERGIYLPRILSDKDPLCGPTLKHEKLAPGVYWYEKKRL